ncbi:MAG: hypothetical protein JNN20_14540 [Betaproteobacteria bacterium]|nr:hypothetical protein [Betaproteobacteria bacterium]
MSIVISFDCFLDCFFVRPPLSGGVYRTLSGFGFIATPNETPALARRFRHFRPERRMDTGV